MVDRQPAKRKERAMQTAQKKPSGNQQTGIKKGIDLNMQNTKTTL